MNKVEIKSEGGRYPKVMLNSDEIVGATRVTLEIAVDALPMLVVEYGCQEVDMDGEALSLHLCPVPEGFDGEVSDVGVWRWPHE